MKKIGIILLSIVLTLSIGIALNPAIDQNEFEFAENGIEYSAPQEEKPYVDPATVDIQNLWTFECEITSRKPEQLTRTCADGGVLVYDIKWTRWSPYGAEGVGIFSVNQCDPNCADGSRLEASVRVFLDTILERKGKFYLTNLQVEPIEPGKLPEGLDPQGWDVSEFAVMMNWD